MTLLPAGVKVHLAFGYIDMRKGINGLAMLVQGVLRQDPFSGHLFVFRGRPTSSKLCSGMAPASASSPSGSSTASSSGRRTSTRVGR
jgi:transposase